MTVLYKNHEITFNKKKYDDRSFDFDYSSKDETGVSGASGSVSECMNEIDERTSN